MVAPHLPLTQAQSLAAYDVITAALDQPKPSSELRAALAQWDRVAFPDPVSWWHPLIQAVAPGDLRLAVALHDARTPLSIADLRRLTRLPDNQVRHFLTKLRRDGIALSVGPRSARRHEYVRGAALPAPPLRVLLLRTLLEHGPLTVHDLATHTGHLYHDVWRCLGQLRRRSFVRASMGKRPTWHVLRMALTPLTPGVLEEAA